VDAKSNARHGWPGRLVACASHSTISAKLNPHVELINYSGKVVSRAGEVVCGSKTR